MGGLGAGRGGRAARLDAEGEGGDRMKLARVILFTGQMEAMGRFYGEVLGLAEVGVDASTVGHDPDCGDHDTEDPKSDEHRSPTEEKHQ